MSSIGARIGNVLRKVLPPAVVAPVIGYANLVLGERELTVVKILCSTTGTSIDVGANYGSYTYFLRRNSGRCIAFEPNPMCASFLRAAYSGLEVNQIALSDHEQLARFFIPGSMDSIENTLGRLRAPGEADSGQPGVSFEVQTRPLDAFNLADVRFIKIDTEGHERHVLRGAIKTVELCHPRMIIECEERHSPGALAAVLDILLPLGYVAFVRTGRRYLSFRTAEDGYGTGKANNFLFIHSGDTLLESAKAAKYGFVLRDEPT